MSFEQVIVEGLGWIGAAAVVIAYYFVSHQKWTGGSLKYHLCNVGGSVLVGLNALYHHALPSMVINIVWLIIGLNALRVFKSRKGNELETG
ncbi:MAG: hypothetical protein DRP71_11150 [Verrucomicrobia bacterium]|nr:MAG: hypothetical protein DRP71_11150 [Verrucomicrobiota bacterium]